MNREGLLRRIAGIVALCIGLTCLVLVTRPGSASANSQGPVAEYSFDEGEGSTLEDLTGDGHTGTIEGAEWVRGRYGDALKFDGEEDVVKIPNSPEFDLGEEFTIEAWVRPEAEEDIWAPIVAKEIGGGEAEKEIAWWLYEADWEWNVPFGGIEPSPGEEENAGAASEPLPVDVWSHLALTWDGATVRLYVDGELVAHWASGPPPTTEGELELGAESEHGDHFVGRIDEVRIYERVLDKSEVDSDMETPVATPRAGPIAEYSFDEGEGSTVEDLSGNGHTATIEGATWTEHGRYGGAMQFDASEHDRLVVPNSPEFDLTEEFTLEAWVRPEGENYWAPIIAKELGGGEGEYLLALWLYGGDWESNVPSGGTETEYGEEADAQSEEALPEHVWSHLALTWDGSRLRLYVDGHLIDSKAGVPPEVTEGNLVIGGGTEYGGYFDGRIDEVRIYDRALAAGEVDTDMETPISTSKRAPVAAYSFDEGEGTTVEDLTGDGHTATIEGAEWTEHGRYGEAMEFDGEGDFLKIPESSELDLTEEFTLEAWVRPEGEGYWSPVIDKENGASEGSAAAYWLYDGEWEPHVPWGGTQPSSGEFTGVEGDEPLPVGKWSQLTVTWDGSRARLYVDGELVDVGPAGAPPITEGNLDIGGSPELGYYFDGRIDEVRIYDRALTGAEVDADMEDPIQTPKRGPVAAYSFDETEGETVEDLSGEENEGTLEGATRSVHGRYGGTVELGGTEGECVKVPNSGSLQLGEEFTLEAWVRPEGSLADDPIFYKQIESGYSYALAMGFSAAGKPEGAVEGEVLRGPTAVEANVWTHLAYTYDGSRAKLYVDGEKVAEETIGPRTLESTGPLYIGCSGPSGAENQSFDGRIDEVRIYERALDGAEVGFDMEDPVRAPRQGPVAAYSFNEGSGSSVDDLTGNGHTATIHGAEWTSQGRYGGAMEFDAARGDYLSVPASDEFDFEEFTLEAWVRPNEARELAPVISNVTTGPGAGPGYALLAGEEGPGAGRPTGFLTNGDTVEEAVDRSEPLPDHVWTHLAMTFNGRALRLYVNGELADTTAAPAADTFGEGELRIGGDEPWDESGFFDGRIDEVRIFNRALRSSELDPAWWPDEISPALSLSGSLMEGLGNGSESRSLTVKAEDGTLATRGSGVARVTISVDGSPAIDWHQTCPETNCSLTGTWEFEPSSYSSSGGHIVQVVATDAAGNTAEQTLELAEPDGDIPACEPNGDAPSLPSGETEALPGGGTVTIYHPEGGMTLRLPTPPESFEPLSASDRELEEYAFPPRPEGATELSEWEGQMRAYKRSGSAALCNGVTSTTATVSGVNQSVSNSWSGFLAYSTSPTAWRGVSANWTQVHHNKPYCPEGLESSWVGLGGWNYPGLIQVGSEISAAGNFYTFLNYLSEKHSRGDIHFSIVPHPGDEIHAAVNYDPGSHTAWLEIYDLTSGEPRYLPLEFTEEEAEEYYEGRTADFVVERNAIGAGKHGPLLNYKTAQWYKAKAKNSKNEWAPIGEVSRKRVTMAQSGTILSQPGFISASSPRRFSTSWKNCQP
ncbi:MAG: hypothetical protein QM729_21120 [Solirubrobacterales bacterium]